VSHPNFVPTADLEKLRRLQELAIQKLTKSDDPVLAEMAREVRAGRMTLREAASSAAYRDVFAVAANRTLDRFRSMSREEIEQGADDELDKLLARYEDEDEDEPARTETRAAQRPEPDEYDFSAPLTQRPPAAGQPTDRQPPQRERWKRRWHG
jgi:hypothetical protein